MSLVTWPHEESNGTVYEFECRDPRWHMQVAVPSEEYMRSAENTALRAALAGIRLGQQHRVQRVHVAAPRGA